MARISGETLQRPGGGVHLLQVEAGGCRCALSLSQVREVLRPLPCQPIPELPAQVRGVAVLRGRPLPVIDLADWLGRDSRGVGRWLHLAHGPRRVALAVDAVHGVLETSAEDWAQMPRLLRDRQGEAALSRFGEIDGELISLVEAARLLPESDWSLLDGRH